MTNPDASRLDARHRLPVAWEARPPELANLLNPAFGAFLLRAAASAHSKECNQGLPLALAYMILPVALHGRSRRSLPETTRTRMVTWLARYPEARIGVAQRVQAVSPYTREALIFALRHRLLALDEFANLSPVRRRLRSYSPKAGSDAAHCVDAAELLGRWFARIGDPVSALAMWGVQV